MDKAKYQATLAVKLGEEAPIEYRYQNHRLAFTPADLGWSGQTEGKIVIAQAVGGVTGRLITNAQEVEGEDDPHLAGKGVIYENAYGEGLHLGALTKNMVFRKIVHFDELASLGTIPAGAEVLEVPFRLHIDPGTTFRARFGGANTRVWDGEQEVVAQGEPVAFGQGQDLSFIEPAHAWDSTGHRLPLELAFKSEGDHLFLTKRIPVAWLRQAVFPVYADVDLTFGTEVDFESAASSYVSSTTLDATHVVFAYRDEGDANKGKAIVGLVSGNVISFPSGDVPPDVEFGVAAAPWPA